MTARPELVLLTARYPFGIKSETFLEAEMEILARRFHRIHVLPSHRDEGVRSLPANAALVEMPWLDGYPARARRRALASTAAVAVLGRTVRGGEAGALVADPRVRLDLLATNVLKARDLAGFLRGGPREALAYDYWLENSTLALALARRGGGVRAAVARAHGFDLYDHRWAHGSVPFRRAKLAGLDGVFAVSEHGARYLRARAPEAADRVHVARLGVRPGAPPPSDDAPPLILTVGSLIPSKRVHRVPGALAATGCALRWLHLGDGPERSRVEAEAAGLPERVSWSLPGHVEHRAVLDFLGRKPVSLLLSLSREEGLPVSMMEAVSYGVPVVAVDVQGVPEVVTPATGLLLDPGAPDAEVARAVTEALAPGRFPRAAVQALARERFDADTNFNAFADHAIALWEDPAALA